MFRITAILMLTVVAVWPGYAAEGETPHYTIATGSKGAAFYPLAKAICQEVARLQTGFTCEAVSTPGSRFNLGALQRGDFDLALSQNYLLELAVRGQPPFTTRHDQIRSIAPLHQEVFTLAVTIESGIEQLDDLRNRRVSIGNPGSGSRNTIEQLLASLGWPRIAFDAHDLKSKELPAALCSGKIDAAIYSTGHPNAIYRRMTDTCGVKLIDLWSAEVAKFVETHRQYKPAVVPAGTYRNQLHPVRGFGARVTLSGSAHLPDCHVARLRQAIQAGRERLVDAVPAAISIPACGEMKMADDIVHPGAAGSCPGADSGD